MSEYKFDIITETTADLPQNYIDEHNIICVPMIFQLDGVEYNGDDNATISDTEFYAKMRQGKTSKTAQITPQKATAIYKDALSRCDNILHICFSSGLSGSYQSCVLAREDLSDSEKERLVCVDSLCASLGQGLLVDYAVMLRDKGLSLKEAAEEIEKVKGRICHYFTVDDLHHLHRGGRVSKASAVFGTMLGIKPVLHVDEEGHLIAIGKVRGRKASLDALVSKMKTKIPTDYKNPYVFISHGDCEEDAKYVSRLVKEEFGLDTKVLNFIGPVIGTHSGPGTVALFFVGTDRAEKKM